MPFAHRNAIPIMVVLAAGISYFAFLVVVTPFLDNRQQQQGPNISTVLIVENATLPTTPTRGYEPQVVKVKIGINNTVKWINQDNTVHGIPTPDDNTDIEFANAVEKEKREHSFLMPNGDSFQYTFTHEGEINYHMEPHPWMKGTVIVLQATP